MQCHDTKTSAISHLPMFQCQPHSGGIYRDHPGHPGRHCHHCRHCGISEEETGSWSPSANLVWGNILRRIRKPCSILDNSPCPLIITGQTSYIFAWTRNVQGNCLNPTCYKRNDNPTTIDCYTYVVIIHVPMKIKKILNVWVQALENIMELGERLQGG